MTDAIILDVKAFKLEYLGAKDYFNGSDLLLIMKDITVEKEFEREKAMSNYSEIMYASTSHEYRTPINATINCLRCIEKIMTPQ